MSSSHSSASSATAMVSTPSLSKLLSGEVAPANSESLDPSFLHLWPHPQQITQYKGTRLFPTSSLSVMLFKQPQTTGGNILFLLFACMEFILKSYCANTLFIFSGRFLVLLYLTGTMCAVI